MADFISLDKRLRFWAPEGSASNLPAKLGSSPSPACSSRSPRGQSMTQALSSMPPIQGGSLTKQVSDDTFVVSSEKKAKDSHDCGTYTGGKDMANTNLFHSDIDRLCPDNDYFLFKQEIIMSNGDKKSNETAVPVGIYSGSSESIEASDGLYSSGASRLMQLGGADAEFSEGEESMSLCTDLSSQSMGSVSDPPYQQDGSALTQVSCNEIHYCTTPCSVPTTTSRSSHLSLDCDYNDQPAPLTRKSAPEPSSNYPNLNQGGLDRIEEQPKSNRIDLDPLLSSPKAGQVLNNGVSITTDYFSSTTTISSHFSSDSGCSDQPVTLIRKSTPEPSSNYPNLSQDGLDKVGEQPKNARTDLDPQPSSLEVDQVLKNGVSSHICISGEDSQKLPQSKTSTGNRYELRDRSRKKRPIAEEDTDNDENESLPLTKRAKGRWRPHEPRSRVTGEPRINRSNATSTGMEGLASAAVNNEKQWPLSDVFLHSIKDNERENLVLYFTQTSSRDEDSTISEMLRGVASINKGGPQTNMLLLSNAVLKLTRINGAPWLTFSSQVEAGGKRCRAHAGQDLTPVEAPPECYQGNTEQGLTPVEAPPECYQENTEQGLTPVEMLLAKVFDVKKNSFKYLAKWKGWHNRSNEWRWESELQPEDVERYNRDHPQNFFGEIVKKKEEKGVLMYRIKWKFISHDYSWLRKDEIVEKLITDYEEKEGKKQ